ncbi:MAG: hypothetical protein AB1861_00880 [Cyanobacteriota bacterium]
MRYTNKEGNTLTLDECMTADSFFMEADVYVGEPLEMHFDENQELKAGKKPKKAVTLNASDRT